VSAQSDLQLIQNIITRLDANPVARFSYTPDAFDNDIIEGVDVFDVNAAQNVPNADKTDYNPAVTNKGVRAQGASIPRMGWNHYVGRLSYNLNKFLQKFRSFLGLYRASLAHNAAEYDSSAAYKTGDVCYTVETVDNVKVYTWYRRKSVTPETISNIPPAVVLHWEEMQSKTSSSALLPFSAPGYRHKFTVADLTDSAFNVNYYYPVVTESFDYDPNQNGIPARVLIEAFTQGVPPFTTNEIRADVAVLSKFTGFGNSSKDIVFDQEYVRLSDGAIQPVDKSPIGYTKLPKGKQAVVWLKGGQKYALWNSFGADFTLYTAEWTNGLDDGIAPVYGTRPFNVKPATILAKLETPDAISPGEAPNLQQVAGALPLPVYLEGGETLRSLRRPGTYIATTFEIGNSLSDLPPQAPQPGVCDIVVKGDMEGLVMTVQQVIPRALGTEYTRVLMGEVVVIDWYKSKSPTGLDILGVKGLWALRIEGDGDLYVYYGAQDGPPPLFIDYNPDSPDFGCLIWEVDS
jgi:hypothetical protein